MFGTPDITIFKKLVRKTVISFLYYISTHKISITPFSMYVSLTVIGSPPFNWEESWTEERLGYE